MKREKKALAFRCPGCKHEFVTDEFDIVGELTTKPSVMIKAQCPKCGKKYIYYAMREYIKGRKVEVST